jgi:hypothetical protein
MFMNQRFYVFKCKKFIGYQIVFSEQLNVFVHISCGKLMCWTWGKCGSNRHACVWLEKTTTQKKQKAKHWAPVDLRFMCIIMSLKLFFECWYLGSNSGSTRMRVELARSTAQCSAECWFDKHTCNSFVKQPQLCAYYVLTYGYV